MCLVLFLLQGAPSSRPEITEETITAALSEQGRRYFEAHQTKRGRGEIRAELRGAPQILMWKVLVQTLIESDMSEITENDRQILETHAGECMEHATLLEENIFACCLSRSSIAGMTKLALCIAEPTRKTVGRVVRALRSLGADWKLGAAPKGPSERDVERLLARLGDCKGALCNTDCSAFP